MSFTRLSKNIIALIIVLVVLSFFYVYKPTTPLKKISNVENTKSTNDFSSHFIEKKMICVNPNTATCNELLQAGFSKKQANNCLNFRKAGGIFYKKEDIKKLYSFTDEDYNRLKSNINIPSKKLQNTNQYQSYCKQFSKTEKTHKQFDLNTCDTIDLKTIPTIGSFRAKKIVEYREKLGGYFSLKQLLAIYSFDSTILNKITQYCFIDTLKIKKLNVNTITFKEMNAHPLISYYQTKNIFEYKKIVGTVKNIDELRERNIIEPSEYETLKYYIKTF